MSSLTREDLEVLETKNTEPEEETELKAILLAERNDSKIVNTDPDFAGSCCIVETANTEKNPNLSGNNPNPVDDKAAILGTDTTNFATPSDTPSSGGVNEIKVEAPKETELKPIEVPNNDVQLEKSFNLDPFNNIIDPSLKVDESTFFGKMALQGLASGIKQDLYSRGVPLAILEAITITPDLRLQVDDAAVSAQLEQILPTVDKVFENLGSGNVGYYKDVMGGLAALPMKKGFFQKAIYMRDLLAQDPSQHDPNELIFDAKTFDYLSARLKDATGSTAPPQTAGEEKMDITSEVQNDNHYDGFWSSLKQEFEPGKTFDELKNAALLSLAVGPEAIPAAIGGVVSSKLKNVATKIISDQAKKGLTWLWGKIAPKKTSKLVQETDPDLELPSEIDPGETKDHMGVSIDEGAAKQQSLPNNLRESLTAFRHKFKEVYSDISHLELLRLPALEAKEHVDFAKFNYVGEGSGEHDKQSSTGRNIIHNLNLREDLIRYGGRLYKTNAPDWGENTRVGTNIELSQPYTRKRRKIIPQVRLEEKCCIPSIYPGEESLVPQVQCNPFTNSSSSSSISLPSLNNTSLKIDGF